MGREMRADVKYARGWEISIPLTPKKLGRVRQRGIKISPLCMQESMKAGRLFPMLWKSIVATTLMGRNIRNMHIILSASPPILTTSASFLKRAMISGAKMKQAAEMIPIKEAPKARVNQVPFFTRENFLAP